jgi:hypothetical protein
MVQGHYGEAIDRFGGDDAQPDAQTRATEARNRLTSRPSSRRGWRDSASTQIHAAFDLFRKAYFEPKFLMH